MGRWTRPLCACGATTLSHGRRGQAKRRSKHGADFADPAELERAIVSLEEEMLAAADDLRFEEAARLRDELKELRRDLDGMRAGA